MKNKKLIIYGSIIVAIIILLILLLRKKNNKTITQPTGTTGGNTGGNTGTGVDIINGTDYEDSTFPLKKGSRGKEVKAVQKVLNQYLPQWIPGKDGIVIEIKKLSVDGIWGSKTDDALYVLSQKTQITKEEYIEGFAIFE